MNTIKQKELHNFTSPVIYTSRKKMISVFRYIKKHTLKQASDYFYCLNKKFALSVHKFIKHIINNMVYQYNLSYQEAQQKIIRFIVLEKTSIKSYSLRYAAKGRAYRTISIATRVNMYIN